MKMLTLLRTEVTLDGTFGKLVSEDFSFMTMEDDWVENRPRFSCIPAGRYTLHRTIYHKHGYETFEVTGVIGRTRILIHPANTEEDVEGCIGLGLRYGQLFRRDEESGIVRLKKAVVSSQEAFRQFMAKMHDVDAATLIISWDPAIDPTRRTQ